MPDGAPAPTRATGRRRRTLAGLAALVAVALSGPTRAEPLPVEEIAPGVYVHRGVHEETTAANLGGIANVGFIVGEAAVAVIDSGGSAAEGARLREAVRRVTSLPIRYVVNSHVHPDHVFGNAAFLADRPAFVGHAKLARAMAERGAHYLAALEQALGDAAKGTEVVPPTLTVADSLELDLGNRVIRLTAHGPAHTDNDLSIYDVKTRTLWTGDLLFADRVPVVDGSLKGWLAVMKELEATEADHVVPGHGPADLAWPQALEAQRRYLGTLLEETRAVIRDGGTIEEAVKRVGRSERGCWLLFETYNPRNVVTAFTELEWE